MLPGAVDGLAQTAIVRAITHGHHRSLGFAQRQAAQRPWRTIVAAGASIGAEAAAIRQTAPGAHRAHAAQARLAIERGRARLVDTL